MVRKNSNGKFISRSMAAVPVTLAALFLAGCGGGIRSSSSTPGAPSAPPPSPSSSATFSVTTINPAAGAINVPLNNPIEMVFSSAADAATVNGTDIAVTDPKPVAGSVSYDAANHTASFMPSAPLTASTTYTVKVSGVTSSSGTALSNPFTWSFTTVAAPPASTATLQYQAPLLTATASALAGQISIDTSGNMTVQLTGATASMTYTVQFCPATNKAGVNITCLSAGSISTDANGNGTLTEMFPQPGSWAGDFDIDSANKTVYSTYLVPGLTGETFMATLQPGSTVNGTGLGSGFGTSTVQQAPLTSGTVTYSKGVAKVTVMGTTPDTGFSLSESETPYLDGSGTYGIGSFTTDSSGDGGVSTTSFGPGGDLFQISSHSVIGFIGGFSIPK